MKELLMNSIPYCSLKFEGLRMLQLCTNLFAFSYIFVEIDRLIYLSTVFTVIFGPRLQKEVLLGVYRGNWPFRALSGLAGHST